MKYTFVLLGLALLFSVAFALSVDDDTDFEPIKAEVIEKEEEKVNVAQRAVLYVCSSHC